MKRLLVICPSRSRPENVQRLIEAWDATSAGVSDLLVATDDDDPTEYDIHPPVLHRRAERLRLAGTLNLWAAHFASDYDYLGFLGDDHRPRTPGWDTRIVAELDRLGTGIVYGNDLLQGEKLPTAVFMTGSIVRALGRMVPPGQVHLFLDDYWRDLGRVLGALSYLPDVVIEHVHPAAGKADWDPAYAESNGWWDHDQKAYRAFVDGGGLMTDALRIRQGTAA